MKIGVRPRGEMRERGLLPTEPSTIASFKEKIKEAKKLIELLDEPREITIDQELEQLPYSRFFSSLAGYCNTELKNMFSTHSVMDKEKMEEKAPEMIRYSRKRRFPLSPKALRKLMIHLMDHLLSLSIISQF